MDKTVYAAYYNSVWIKLKELLECGSLGADKQPAKWLSRENAEILFSEKLSQFFGIGEWSKLSQRHKCDNLVG